MTDRERDAPRPGRDHDAHEDPTAESEADEADASVADGLAGETLDDVDAADLDEAYDAFAAEEIGAEADDEVEEAPAAAAGTTSARARFGQRLGRGDSAAAATLATPSERAVRIDDRASQVYVVGVVATFLGILLFGMLWGTRGFFTTVPPSPPPSLTSPSGSASPSSSVVPSAGSPSPGASSATSPAASPLPSGS